MPGVTPVYGIPYPCTNDAVTVASFQDFADAVDAALTTLNTLADEALTRPTAKVFNSATQTIVGGVLTTAIFNSEIWDSDNLADLGVNNDRFTIQTPGTYLLTAQTTFTGAGALATGAIGLSLNGVTHYRIKDRDGTGFRVTVDALGLFTCVAGDILRATFESSGSNADCFFSQMSVRLINRP